MKQILTLFICIGQSISIIASASNESIPATRLHYPSYNRDLATYPSHQSLNTMYQHPQHPAHYSFNAQQQSATSIPPRLIVNIVNSPTVTNRTENNLENEANVVNNNKPIIPNYTVPPSSYITLDTITNWITTHKSLVCASGFVLYVAYHYNTIRIFKNYLKKNYRWSGWRRTINNYELHHSENKLQLTQELLYDIQLRYINNNDPTNPIRAIQLFLNDLIEEEKLINQTINAYKKLNQIKLTRVLFLPNSLYRVAEQCKVRIMLLRELVCRLLAQHNSQLLMNSLGLYH